MLCWWMNVNHLELTFCILMCCANSVCLLLGKRPTPQILSTLQKVGLIILKSLCNMCCFFNTFFCVVYE